MILLVKHSWSPPLGNCVLAREGAPSTSVYRDAPQGFDFAIDHDPGRDFQDLGMIYS